MILAEIGTDMHRFPTAQRHLIQQLEALGPQVTLTPPPPETPLHPDPQVPADGSPQDHQHRVDIRCRSRGTGRPDHHHRAIHRTPDSRRFPVSTCRNQLRCVSGPDGGSIQAVR